MSDRPRAIGEAFLVEGERSASWSAVQRPAIEPQGVLAMREQLESVLVENARLQRCLAGMALEMANLQAKALTVGREREALRAGLESVPNSRSGDVVHPGQVIRDLLSSCRAGPLGPLRQMWRLLPAGWRSGARMQRMASFVWSRADVPERFHGAVQASPLEMPGADATAVRLIDGPLPAAPLVRAFAHYRIPLHIAESQAASGDQAGRLALREELDLACRYGMEGFCFSAYWLAGQPLLRGAVDLYLASPELSAPFCLCWELDAPGGGMGFAAEDAAVDQAFFSWVASCMRDPRYLRVDGRPLLLVRGILGEALRASLLDGLLTAAAGDVRLICQGGASGWSESECVSAGHPSSSSIGASIQVARGDDRQGVDSPLEYQQRLSAQIERALTSAAYEAGRLVFVDSWNDWASGLALEPTHYLGGAYLDATRMALLRHRWRAERSLAVSRQVAIAIHAFYPEILGEILAYLDAVQDVHIKLFVSVTAAQHDAVSALLSAGRHPFELHVFDNRGRDMLPFLRLLPGIAAQGYGVLIKVHTKKSPHRLDGHAWREDLYGKLLSGPSVTAGLAQLAASPGVGVIAPEGHVVPMSCNWAPNASRVIQHAERMGVPAQALSGLRFAAGSMFMARTAALMPLLALGVEDEDFEDEAGQLDGTLAHVLERLVAVSAQSVGLDLVDSAAGGICRG